MTEEQFYNTTPRTFNNILNGRKHALDKEEAEFKQRMEMHRELIVTILSPHMSKADRNKPISKIYPFPWDAKPVKVKADKKNPLEFWEEIDKRTKKE
jgi:hypothetical protein